MYMKVCLVLQNQYCKVAHSMARYLKSAHGVDEFCAYIFSPGAKDFVLSQTEIRYDPILVDHELHARFGEEKIDVAWLNHFEKNYGPPYPWQYLYCDRKLMMSIGPKEETTAVIDPLYNHESLIKIFQVRARAIEKMLNEAKPDFILFFAIGTLGHLILYHVAKKLGRRVYNIDFPRVRNLVSISEDYNTLSLAEITFREFRKESADTHFHHEARALIERFRKTGSLDLQYLEIALDMLPGRLSTSPLNRIGKSLKYLNVLTKNYACHHDLYRYGQTDQNPLRFLAHKLKQRYRLWRGYNDLYDEIRPDKDNFVFYPLHYEPELAILLLSPFYFNQIELIRYIARSLPLDYKLYVKEHPAMYSKRARSYYQELKKIPNVVLVDTNIKSSELVNRAKVVTTITGTAGWEASLLGKPVITFGEVFYNALSFVKRVRNIETLPEVMRAQINDFRFDAKEMEHFVAATLKESMPFDFSALWFENDLEKLYQDKGLRNFCDRLMKMYHARV